MIFECVEMQKNDFSLDETLRKLYPAETARQKDDIDDLDLLPEFCHYRDEGCKLAPSCLDCPFPVCVEDRWRGEANEAKKIRDKEIVRLHTIGKIKEKELSVRFHLNLRTINRIIANARKQDE